ncbi:hypothetical protein [Fulvitalea axinellae]
MTLLGFIYNGEEFVLLVDRPMGKEDELDVMRDEISDYEIRQAMLYGVV